MVFKLFANCIPVKGASRSIIYDLARKIYRFIPNGLYHIITEFEGMTIDEVKLQFSKDEHEIIDDYFTFLEKHEFIFYCPPEIAKNFPALEYKWDTPSKIQNAIIDIGSHSKHNYELIFNTLQRYGCRHIQIRSFTRLTDDQLKAIFSKLTNGITDSVELLVKHSREAPNDFERLLFQYPVINSLVIHSSPYNSFGTSCNYTRSRIVSIEQEISSPFDCNHISPESFQCNTELFMEAQFHNPYFNRKLTIDSEGNIRNCSGIHANYGALGSENIDEIVESAPFREHWNVPKDKITICSDCEFRYMCVDSREPKRDAEGTYYFEKPCPYDPYTMQWEIQLN